MVFVQHVHFSAHALQPPAVLNAGKFGVVRTALLVCQIVDQPVALHGLSVCAGEREPVACIHAFFGLVVIRPIGI